VAKYDAPPDPDLSRRDALKIAVGVGAAAVIPLVPAELSEAAQRAAAAGKPAPPRFFTAEQQRAVEALTEVIIPADERSPGARAARVADYLDFMLNEAPDEARTIWREGLVALDEASTSEFGKGFADLAPDQQVAVVTSAARNERQPATVLERFFVEAKGRTIHGYYTSAIGIHQELKYKGNQFLAEFVGCDHPEHGE
jgi:hypothetical protein